MLEPPVDLPDSEVLRLLRTHWDTDVDAVEHLPVGRGAWHWRADLRGRPTLFVTVEELGPRHTLTSLEQTYAGAASLAFALDTVVAGLPARDLRYAVEAPAGRALSVTPWVWGERAGDGPPADRADAEATARTLRRLHAATPPPGLRRWAPLVGPDLGDRLPDVREWTARYHRLAAAADDRPWVATHGEPHPGHQLRSPTGRLLLVGWRSLMVAPAERDLRRLVEAGHGDLPGPAGADAAMLELFDLERRLVAIDRSA